MIKKAKVNFPDDFYFSVYEQYAIFGGLRLLHQNNFEPAPFTATAVLEALRFKKINKGEVSDINKAFSSLTKRRFPCYHIREDKNKEGVFQYSEADTPIFMIYEQGKVNLNVDVANPAFSNKKLFLCLLNPALVEDLRKFFVMIDSNLLANLRNFKKVTEDDLYFIEYLIKEKIFHKKIKTDLTKICKIMKKNSWIEPKGLDREHKRQIKDKTSQLLKFAKSEKLADHFIISTKDQVEISFSKEQELLSVT